MNEALREVGMDFNRPYRAELVICQIILMTHDVRPFIRTVEDFVRSFGFEEELAHAEENLGMFAWYMEYALMLVRAKGHMDFIINDVVAPLSENRSGRRFTSGGGSESISTMMRYTIFERMTGQPRPKNAPLSAASATQGPSYHDVGPPYKIANTSYASAADVSVISNEDDYPLLSCGTNAADSVAVPALSSNADSDGAQLFLFDSLPLQHDAPASQDGSMGFLWGALTDGLLDEAVEQSRALLAPPDIFSDPPHGNHTEPGADDVSGPSNRGD
jgi:hypothetical protein